MAAYSPLLIAIGVALGSNSLRPRRSSCQPSNRYPPRSGSRVRATRSHFLPPLHGTGAGERFPEAEWFYNIVVRPEFEADDAIDFVETMAGRDDNRNIRVGTNFPTDKFGRFTARQSRNGTVDQRSSAIDAGPAGIAPRCGRRQFDLDTSLDDEWIVKKDRIAAMTNNRAPWMDKAERLPGTVQRDHACG